MTKLILHMTKEAERQFAMFIDMHPTWLLSEAMEIARKHGANNRYGGSVDEAYGYVFDDGYIVFFMREFGERNHRRSAIMAKAKMNMIDPDVLQRWIFEEQHEPQHAGVGIGIGNMRPGFSIWGL